MRRPKRRLLIFRRNKEAVLPLPIEGQKIEILKYLGVHLDSKLNWKKNGKAVFKTTQSRRFFLRKLSSFGISGKLLHVFYQGIPASVLFCFMRCFVGELVLLWMTKVGFIK